MSYFDASNNNQYDHTKDINPLNEFHLLKLTIEPDTSFLDLDAFKRPLFETIIKNNQ